MCFHIDNALQHGLQMIRFLLLGPFRLGAYYAKHTSVQYKTIYYTVNRGLHAECHSGGFRILTYKHPPLKAKALTVYQIGNHDGYKVQFRVRPAAVYLGRNNRIFHSQRSVLKPLQHPHILILTILRRRLTKKYVPEKKKELYHDYNILSKDTESLMALGLLNSSPKIHTRTGVSKT